MYARYNGHDRRKGSSRENPAREDPTRIGGVTGLKAAFRLLRKFPVPALLLVAVLAACSSSPDAIDPSRVEAFLSSDPEPVRVGEPVALTATFTGARFPEETYVYCEIRAGKKPVYLEAERAGEDRFVCRTSFGQAGTFDVYLHLYVAELHIAKKRQVEGD